MPQATKNEEHVMLRENRIALPVGVVVFKPNHQNGLTDVDIAGTEDRASGKASGRSPDFKTHSTGYDPSIA